MMSLDHFGGKRPTSRSPRPSPPGTAGARCAVDAAREVAEEVSLDIEAGELLVIDWVPPQGDRPRVMTNYIFDGGTIEDPSGIRLQDTELDDARFWTWEQAETKMPASTAARIPAARRARRMQRAIYLPAS
jgi:8-oxo-dGTP diphosphatase